ncbi:hypothetical protein F2Q68_00006204 [Brassica cretica]|uniref:Uncharacterized protein n=1 Tax=Brassica cretica TaxID=69181 RepID=A0A8S9JBB6_BRACR|nr:hypothetical protein F2Q68_00006204 [Brassica cretica]
MLPGAEVESRRVLGSGGGVHQATPTSHGRQKELLRSLVDEKQGSSALRAHRAKADYSDQDTESSGSY